ncbi:hypothetical protein CALCODRAFT_509593 [Calocera cornea HHB12733]|uniref:DUF6532 domain-containing protein n=1 Tax=Calocera cornea HHB12733 TaxID=1353952 RepID=A0A165F575_9BASI|nr:hypothetical protein CALCODRAFT_509593 [Calocera cornea HHB12733]
MPNDSKEQSFILRARDQANEEATTVDPSAPKIDFQENPGIWTLLKKVGPTLRSLFKTKAASIMREEYREVFEPYAEAQIIEASLKSTTQKKVRTQLDTKRRNLRRRVGEEIVRLLDGLSFIYPDEGAGTGEDSGIPLPCLNPAIVRLIANMGYMDPSRSTECSEAAIEPDLFDPVPWPMISYTVLTFKHILSCYRSGYFRNERIYVFKGENIRTYHEMLRLLTELRNEQKHEYTAMITKLSAACFATHNLRPGTTTLPFSLSKHADSTLAHRSHSQRT